MKLVHICPASWGSNCYLLCSDGQAFVIDPSPSADAILRHADEAGVSIKAILLTHGHFDHVLSAETLHDKTGAPVMIHEADTQMLADGSKNAYSVFFGQNRAFRPADELLQDGQILTLGDEQLRVLSTPGHSRGSICLVAEDLLITGDTLFAAGYGRTDLWGGSMRELAASLGKLSALPHHLTVYPGHGDSATLGQALSNLGL